MSRSAFAMALILLSSGVPGLPAEQKPGWVQKRPVSRIYYIGIGMARKGAAGADYVQSAKNKALNDLASEITVNISGELVSQVVEQSGMVEEAVRSEIRARTQASLEGFELIDTWENDSEYWVYYRLSKSLYAERQQARLNRAMGLALDLFATAQRREQAQEITDALIYYLQSIMPIQNHMSEPLKTTYEGKKIYLLNEIFSALQYTLSHIELIPPAEKLWAKTGQPPRTPLVVTAVYSANAGAEVPVNNLPIKFSFIRGSADYIEKVRSTRDGKAICRISKVTSPEKLQIVKASVDLSQLVQLDSLNAISRAIVSRLLLPEARVVLSVSGLSVCIQASEVNLGKRLEIPYLEPALKKALTARGFHFEQDMARADFLIEIEARSRKGSQVYDLCTAFVDMTISATDMKTGKEVYKNSLQNINGAHVDYSKAGLKAFEKAAEKLRLNLVPHMLAALQR